MTVMTVRVRTGMMTVTVTTAVMTVMRVSAVIIEPVMTLKLKTATVMTVMIKMQQY